MASNPVGAPFNTFDSPLAGLGNLFALVVFGGGALLGLCASGWLAGGGTHELFNASADALADRKLRARLGAPLASAAQVVNGSSGIQRAWFADLAGRAVGALRSENAKKNLPQLATIASDTSTSETAREVSATIGALRGALIEERSGGRPKMRDGLRADEITRIAWRIAGLPVEARQILKRSVEHVDAKGSPYFKPVFDALNDTSAPAAIPPTAQSLDEVRAGFANVVAAFRASAYALYALTDKQDFVEAFDASTERLGGSHFEKAMKGQIAQTWFNALGREEISEQLRARLVACINDPSLTQNDVILAERQIAFVHDTCYWTDHGAGADSNQVLRTVRAFARLPEAEKQALASHVFESLASPDLVATLAKLTPAQLDDAAARLTLREGLGTFYQHLSPG